MMKCRLGLAALFAATHLFAQDVAAFPSSRFPIQERREAFVSGGRKITVEAFTPAGKCGSPAVLVLHSSAGMLAGKSELVRFSKALAEKGLAAFLVHYFDRTGTVFAGDEEIHKLSPVWTETVKDAVDFVASHPQVRHHSIGIFGYSLGAYLTVAESSRDSRVRAIAEVAGGIFEGFRPRMRRLPPLLILHGKADRRVPVARAFELLKAAKQLGSKPEMMLYPGEGHVLTRPATADATHRALNFLERRLKP